MVGISKGIGVSPVDGINSGAAGINSGLSGIAGGTGSVTPPAAPTYYQRMIPGALLVDADGSSTYQASIPGSVFVDGR
jgi:hypothetical protein